MLGSLYWLCRNGILKRALRLSQAQLAFPLPVTPQQAAPLERGESQLHVLRLFLLARLLGTQVDFFLSLLLTGTKKRHVALVDATMSVSRAFAEELKLDPDGRSSRELNQIVKAVSRIPHGEAYSQLLQMVISLSDINKLTVIHHF